MSPAAVESHVPYYSEGEGLGSRCKGAPRGDQERGEPGELERPTEGTTRWLVWHIERTIEGQSEELGSPASILCHPCRP